MSAQLQAALRAQREHIEELTETVRQLREMLAPPTVFPPRLGLTRSEQQLLAVLLARSPNAISRESIMAALYLDPAGAPDDKIIDVRLFRMRKALARFGAGVVTHHGFGFSIDKESAEVLHGLLKGEPR